MVPFPWSQLAVGPVFRVWSPLRSHHWPSERYSLTLPVEAAIGACPGRGVGWGVGPLSRNATFSEGGSWEGPQK